MQRKRKRKFNSNHRKWSQSKKLSVWASIFFEAFRNQTSKIRSKWKREKMFSLTCICREGKNRNTLYFYSKHSGVMTWQAHVSGHAPSPPPTGRDESEDTQVEWVLFEHSFEQVKLKAVLSFSCTCYFQHFGFIKNKRTSSKPFHLMCYYFKTSVK